jgi:hypothetical protein
MSIVDKKYYHNIDLDSNELKSGRIYNVTTSDRTNLKTNFLANTPANFKGYIVYDIIALSLYVWNGTDWTTAAGGSGTVTSVSAGTGMIFTTITGAGSVSINTLKVPYLASGFSTGFLKWDGSVWGFDNNTYLTGPILLDNMSKLPANTIIGNNTTSLATPIALSGTQVTAMLDIFTDTTKGLVPVSSSGASPFLFLSSDGNWQKIGTSGIVDQSGKTLLANTTGSTGAVSAVAISSITTELSVVVGDGGSGGTKGLVPTPGAGDATAGKVLKANGLWAVPTHYDGGTR